MQILDIPSTKKELKKAIKEQAHRVACVKDLLTLNELHLQVLERHFNAPKSFKPNKKSAEKKVK